MLDQLARANEEANPALFRLAMKMATGSGKTTVMAKRLAAISDYINGRTQQVDNLDKSDDVRDDIPDSLKKFRYALIEQLKPPTRQPSRGKRKRGKSRG